MKQLPKRVARDVVCRLQGHCALQRVQRHRTALAEVVTARAARAARAACLQCRDAAEREKHRTRARAVGTPPLRHDDDANVRQRAVMQWLNGDGRRVQAQRLRGGAAVPGQLVPTLVQLVAARPRVVLVVVVRNCGPENKRQREQ